MKKILIAFLAMAFVGCENFLDTEDLTRKNTQNFPESEAEMNDLLTGVYYAARAVDMEDNANCPFVISEIMSDDRFAGGAPDDFLWSNLENFGSSNFNYDFLLAAWEAGYRAIFRANTVITSAGSAQFAWSADAQKSVIGQAAFLRGYTFFNMARMFGPVPMPLTPDPVNLPRASADELYAQIAADMKLAIESMPATVGQPVRGRATKWAAEAMMARVWLFYTGYYEKDALPLPDGTSVSKADVVGWLEDCIDNSGHKLIDDFRNLWPYSNELTKRDGYLYASKNKLQWVGEEGANTETVFSWPTAPGAAGWSGDTPTGNSNRICLYFSRRTMSSDEVTFPFGLGWGFGTVNSQLWDNWPDADPRKKGSIADVRDPDEMKAYEWGADNQLHDTGLWQKKYTAINVRQADGSFVNFAREYYGDFVNTDFQLNNTQDLITMRFADVLLMHSELTGTADGMTRVRARAGLDAVPYTVDALRNERRWELAFEGVRYYDLLRWGIAAQALDRQNGVAVMNAGVDGLMSFPTQAARLPQTKGLMPVPETQIELSKVGGVPVLTQTPGWER